MAKQTKRKSATSDGLGEYRAKRDFGATPEPAPGEAGADGGRFVVQEHSATRLHWDLRLEHDGVAVSWAVPNGIPEVPGENRMAVHTEDHPLEYLEWEGVIPKGNYGAGTMKVWDRGTYEAHEWTSDKVTATFHGERVRGRYHLFEIGDKNWMIRRVDPPLDPDREPMPAHVVPLMPVRGSLPRDDSRHAYEVRWDGIRAIAFCEPGRLRLDDDTGGDLTERFPDVRRLTRNVGAHYAVLDGELVALGSDGKPDPKRLERRLRPGSDSTMRARAREAPVVYEIYDLLYLDGRSLTALPWRERRERLLGLELGGDNWRVSQHHDGDGAALLEAARANGLPGIVAKPLDSPYAPGAGWISIAAGDDVPRFALQHPERVVYRASGFTAADVAEYYAAVAPVLLPHLHGRGPASEDQLLRLVDDGQVELQMPLALPGDPERPTAVVFATEAPDAALLLHGMFRQLGLESFAKTTGGGGLQVWLPLNSEVTWDQTEAFAQQVAQLLKDRGADVDPSLNGPGKTTISPYSLCAGKRPAVSTPLTWDEVEAGELEFSPEVVTERISEHGDLFAPVLAVVQQLPG